MTRAFEQQLLGGEENVGDMARLAVDAELVAENGIECTHEAHHRAPELRRQQPVTALATALDQVDKRIGLTQQQPGASDARTPPDGVAIDPP